jgi:hypothetical protein
MRDNANARRRQVATEMSRLGFCLPGSLVQRTSRCGTPTCACHSDTSRLHGPYWSWTRKVNGKTVTRNLDARQLERYRPWFDNASRLRALMAELEAISAEVAEQAEGWGAKPSDNRAANGK